MTRPHVTDPNRRPTPPPRFQVELQWQGPPLDAHGFYLAAGLLQLFVPDNAKAVAPLLQQDFQATFTADPNRLQQLLQCLGILRAHRIRFAVWEPGDTLDDVTDKLDRETSWSYYPDIERAARVQTAVAQAQQPSGRPRGTRLGVMG